MPLNAHSLDACLASRPTSKDEDALQLVAHLRSPWTIPISTALPCLTAVPPAWHSQRSGHSHLLTSGHAHAGLQPQKAESLADKRDGGVQDKPLDHPVQRSGWRIHQRRPAWISIPGP